MRPAAMLLLVLLACAPSASPPRVAASAAGASASSVPVREPSDAELQNGRLVVVLGERGAAPRRRVDMGFTVDRDAVVVDSHTDERIKSTYGARHSGGVARSLRVSRAP